MLPGVIIKSLKRLSDERGFFIELMREDWIDFLGEDEISQANFSMSYPKIIRAWHRHIKRQIDYFIVIKGALKICVFDEETKELTEIVSTDKNLQVVRVPGHYWHGFKVISDESAMLLYFTTNLYTYNNPDEERRPWNDQTLIPTSINNRKDDLRLGKPWDWNYPAHK